MTSRTMTTPILVTGGTGTLGRHVVRRLREAGREVRVLSRHSREPDNGVEFVAGDLATGEGVDAALQGVERVIHLAGGPKGDGDKARNLVAAAKRADVRHLVYISVVGADRIPVDSRMDRNMFGYFAEKADAERVVADSGLPWTTLRATQFHDLVLKVSEGMAKLPLIPVPTGFLFQPIEADEVAARLVELALDEPAGLVADVAGPRVYELKQLVGSYLQASGKHRPIVPLRLPGKGARAFREGAAVSDYQPVGRRTWEEFLAARLHTPDRATGTTRTTEADSRTHV